MRYYSPLRYPGGKRKLSKFIKSIFKKNDLLEGCYVEPYAGGAAIAFSLLLCNYVSKIIINDFDRSIYAFWHSVLYDTELLCRLINDTKINITTWTKQKAIQQNKEHVELIELGFSTFFLNRTNRSGIIKGGVIGGKNQSGNYKMDARFNKTELISRISKIAAHKNQIKLYNLDAIKLVENISKKLPKKTLFYFDPPYYLKGKNLYVNYYNHEDHSNVSKMIDKLSSHRWLVSYDNTPEVANLYKKYRNFAYSLNYSAVNATSGREIMIYHSDLKIPEYEDYF